MTDAQQPELPSIEHFRACLFSIALRPFAVTDAELTRLESTVDDVTRDMRNAGQPPEAVVVAIRRVAGEARLGRGSDPLIEQLVVRAIKAYFRDVTAA